MKCSLVLYLSKGKTEKKPWLWFSSEYTLIYISHQVFYRDALRAAISNFYSSLISKGTGKSSLPINSLCHLSNLPFYSSPLPGTKNFIAVLFIYNNNFFNHIIFPIYNILTFLSFLISCTFFPCCFVAFSFWESIFSPFPSLSYQLLTLLLYIHCCQQLASLKLLIYSYDLPKLQFSSLQFAV